MTGERSRSEATRAARIDAAAEVVAALGWLQDAGTRHGVAERLSTASAERLAHRIGRAHRAGHGPRLRARAAVALGGLAILALSAASPLHDLRFRGSLPASIRPGGAIESPLARGPLPRGAGAMNRKQVLSAMAGVGVVAAGAAAQEAVQWRVEDGGNGHWYQWIDTATTLSSELQVTFVAERGAHLWTITSVEEAQFLAPHVPPENCLLGGIRGADGVWRWMTGEVWLDGLWCPGQPDWPHENRVSFFCVENGQVQFGNVGEPGLHMHFVALEWSADCNADGVVDYGQILAGELEDLDGNGVPDCCDAGVPCNSMQTAVQWRVEDGGNGHWYQGIAVQSITWVQSRDAAESVGGHLASLASSAENDFVFQAVADRADLWNEDFVGPWLGGFQQVPNGGPAADWGWTDGSPWSFTAWNAQAPNDGPGVEEAFLHYYIPSSGVIQRSKYWNDTTNDTGLAKRGYIIEWSADCNADGVVDYGQILAGELEDLDGNGVPDCCDAGVPCAPCAADLDGNGAVDGVDLAVILSKWGTNGGKDYPNADIDGDGTIGGADLALVLGSWGACP